MLGLDQGTGAVALGYASIGCWLCAQLPQVIKNYKLQSCEGLAFPFLVTWLCGDFTNYIGCVLTHQLPFQTYLAFYFCVVDVTLVAQFYYYGRRTAGPTRRGSLTQATPHSSLILPQRSRSAHPGSAGPTSPLPHINTLGARASSGRGRRRATAHAHANTMPYTESPVTAIAPDIEALYAAALDVARAAERVSLRRSNSGRPRTRHGATVPLSAQHAEEEEPGLGGFNSEHSLPSNVTTDDEDERAHPRMTQSMGALADIRGRSLARATESYPSLGTPPAEHADDVSALPESGMLEVRRRRGPSRSQSRSQSVARTRGTSRRAAGVAFMSLGLLAFRGAAIGSMAPRHASDGHVVERPGAAITTASAASAASPWPSLHPLPLPHTHRDLSGVFVQFESVNSTKPGDNGTHPGDGRPPRQEAPISMQEFIGRISAWCCTTLYLTSRLPQIWKNFQRKSVEGLSILLFVFAFLGNVMYVLSIILAPVPAGETTHYLLKALPYLLGSGGTLIFDLTIMIQSAVYGEAPPETPLDPHRSFGPRRAYTYAGVPRHRRSRTQHSEDGLPSSGGMYGSLTRGSSERRPLLGSATASPVRRGSGTFDWPRPGVIRGATTPSANLSRESSRVQAGPSETAGLGVKLFGESPEKHGSKGSPD